MLPAGIKDILAPFKTWEKLKMKKSWLDAS